LNPALKNLSVAWQNAGFRQWPAYRIGIVAVANSRLIRRLTPWDWLLLAFVCALTRLSAEDIVFPPDAGVIDVRRSPYFAKGDGLTDDTEALQQALLENGDRNRIIYLPNGTYRISGTLRWPSGSAQKTVGRTILQGQSRAGAVIQLLDYSPAFGNAGKPQAMVWTGAKGESHRRNAVRNLTLHTGIGNPGATGVQFLAHKQGSIREVDIVAGGGGEGATGLDLSHSEAIGPLLVKNVRIRGFDTAIRAANPVFSITFEDIEVTGQKLTGLRNSGQVLTLRNFRSTNSGPAIQNTDAIGFVTVLDSSFQGLAAKRPGPAVINRGILVARNITTPGYTNAIENRAGHADGAPGPTVQEYQSHDLFTLFPAPPFALNLPIEETPEPPLDPLSDWASPAQFGGKPDDAGDDSEALQKAVDSGATTIYLPNGTWHLRNPVEVRGKVRRIVGTEAELVVATPPGQPAFRVGDTAAPTVWFERLDVEGVKNSLVQLAAERRIVFRECSGVSLDWKSKGRVFLEDVSSVMPWELGPGQSLWARQWSQQFQGLKLANRGGTAWLMGYTTERPGILVATTDGGKTEVLGGLCLANGVSKSMPMFRIVDASASIIMAEASFTSTPYQIIIEETRNGAIRRLRNFGISGDQPLPQRVGGVAVPLFTGYFGVGAVEPKSGVPKPKTTR